MFANRKTAGVQLGKKVEQYLDGIAGLSQLQVVVVGLPRGGVPVALEVARNLGCPLEVIVAKKLPYPGQPEFAIGAVSSDGVVVLSPDIPHEPQWNAYIDRERQALLQRTRALENEFYALANRTPCSFKNKTVVVVDDGIATGMTAMAALATARQRGARLTILATPVISANSCHDLKMYCDDIIALSIPVQFRAVGHHYLDFNQTTNQEVISAMQQASAFAATPQLEEQVIKLVGS